MSSEWIFEGTKSFQKISEIIKHSLKRWVIILNHFKFHRRDAFDSSRQTKIKNQWNQKSKCCANFLCVLVIHCSEHGWLRILFSKFYCFIWNGANAHSITYLRYNLNSKINDSFCSAHKIGRNQKNSDSFELCAHARHRAGGSAAVNAQKTICIQRPGRKKYCLCSKKIIACK